MRKNAVIKELRSISGGICAPDGFLCGGDLSSSRSEGSPDIALLTAEKRCPAACIFSDAEGSGATYANKKRLRYGHARAILINGKVANAFQTGGVRNTEKLYYAVETALTIPTDEILTLTTGKIGKRFPYDEVVSKIKPLTSSLGSGEEHIQRAGLAFQAKQLAFEGYLGDFPCKFGAIFGGGLLIITTDVNIAAPSLKKALIAEYRETLELTDFGNAPSPNDTVCMLASGRAGNYCINAEDTEYDKFCNLLRQTLVAVCKAIATDEERGEKPLVCTVQGARSKQMARRLAKQIVTLSSVKRAYAQGEVDVENIVHAAVCLGKISADAIQISICAEGNKAVLFESLHAFHFTRNQLARYFTAEDNRLIVSIGEGNYSAMAIAKTSCTHV